MAQLLSGSTVGGVPIETTTGAQAKANAVQANLDNHKNASTLDHPDNSVTDSKIGNRTVD